MMQRIRLSWSKAQVASLATALSIFAAARIADVERALKAKAPAGTLEPLLAALQAAREVGGDVQQELHLAAGEHPLALLHARRLREIYRSAGWPCQDTVEIELLVLLFPEQEFCYRAMHLVEQALPDDAETDEPAVFIGHRVRNE